jgi:hypothetical protein
MKYAGYDMRDRWIGFRLTLGLIVTLVAAPTLAQRVFPHGGSLPIYGIWGNSQPPAALAAAAGFDWFETGYPDQGWNASVNATLRAGNCVPLAYIDVSEWDPSIADKIMYDGPFLGAGGGSNRKVDVTHPSWRSWILRRVDQAMAEGSGGIKWDVADPDASDNNINATKTRQQVNDTLASIYSEVRARYPSIVMVQNQGFKFAQYVNPNYSLYMDGMTTEGLFANSAFYLHPWDDPDYWGPQYNNMRTLQNGGIPAIDITKFVDPYSQAAGDIYDASTAKNFVPYILNDSLFQQKGRALYIPPDWPEWAAVCMAPLTHCGGNCVNTSSDINDCGACWNKCPPDPHATCSSGHCSCTSGFTLCASSCVDIHWDVNNCGSCGHACGPHMRCIYLQDARTSTCVSNL